MIYHAHSLYLMFILQLIHLLLFCVTFPQCAFFQLMPYLSFCTKFYSSTLLMVFLIHFLFLLSAQIFFIMYFLFCYCQLRPMLVTHSFVIFSLLIITNIFYDISFFGLIS